MASERGSKNSDFRLFQWRVSAARLWSIYMRLMYSSPLFAKSTSSPKKECRGLRNGERSGEKLLPSVFCVYVE
jgi:hypothetical protein